MGRAVTAGVLCGGSPFGPDEGGAAENGAWLLYGSVGAWLAAAVM